MSLQVETHTTGNVAILRCTGRIVAGQAATALDTEVRRCFSEHLSVVLDLSEVTHVDSSGLGLLVRLTCATRNTALQMKLCSASAAIQKLIALTNLCSVLPHHETPAEALRALSHRAPGAAIKPGSITVLCVHPSLDVLAYLRESLSRSGYEVQTTSSVPDAIVFIKARNPKLVIAAPDTLSKLSAPARDRNIPLLELASDLATQDPTDALATLTRRISSAVAGS